MRAVVSGAGDNWVRWRLFPPPSRSFGCHLCAEPSRFAPICLAKSPPGCTRGRFRTQEPVVVAEDNWLRPGTAFGLSFPALTAGPLPLTSRGRLRPPGASCHSASRVRRGLFLFTSASSKHLSCAPGALSAHRMVCNHFPQLSLLLFRNYFLSLEKIVAL